MTCLLDLLFGLLGIIGGDDGEGL